MSFSNPQQQLSRQFRLAENAQVKSEITKAAISQCRFAVKALESGHHDLGLYTGPAVLDSNSSYRTLFLNDHRGPEHGLVALNIKCIQPRFVQEENGFEWRIKLSVEQTKYCQALIVGNPKEPSYYALLPTHIFRNEIYEGAMDAQSDILHSFLHPPPAFAPEWSPFILPSAKLGEALLSMRGYAVGILSEWSVQIQVETAAY
ncbi:MAG: hypothetical protein Q9174_003075 [Haloplaca sp. 1 TL-2023]